MKKNYKPKKETVTLASIEKRMPKGWKHFGSNDISFLWGETITPEKRSKIDHTWMLAIKQAEREGKQLKLEMAKRRSRKLEDDISSNAEVLVQKKYKKDKQQ